MLFQLSLLAALVAGPTQIAPTSPGQQRAANRQALREARQANVPYKESHLTVTHQQLKRGGPGGPPGVAPEPHGRPDGRPRKGLRLPGLPRRVKTEPTP